MNPKSVFLVVAVFMVFAGIFLAENSPAEETRYVELVEPDALKGPMSNYEYDLYRLDADGPKYVEPPEYDYRDPIELDYPVLREMRVSTVPTPIPIVPTPLPSASRELTIDLNLNAYSFLAGEPVLVTYELKPATKTVILEGLTATAVVQILPEAVDFYVAAKNPSGVFYFLTPISGAGVPYSRKIQPFFANWHIDNLFGIIGGYRLDSRAKTGWYGVRAVMVSPGDDVRDENNWISNYSYGNSDANTNPLTPANFTFGIVD